MFVRLRRNGEEREVQKGEEERGVETVQHNAKPILFQTISSDDHARGDDADAVDVEEESIEVDEGRLPL